MSIYDRDYYSSAGQARRPAYQLRSNWSFTPVIKLILTINIAVFILNFVSTYILKIPFFLPSAVTTPTGQFLGYGSSEFVKVFGLYTPYFLGKFCFWQIFTYQFMHVDMMHIFFNMFALVMLGQHVERQIGSTAFLKLYLAGGVFAGVINFIFAIASASTPMIGASGSICAIIATFGLLNPNERIMFFFFIMRAKNFVILYAAITVFMGLSGSGGNVAHFAHLGGLIFGWLYVYNICHVQKFINTKGHFANQQSHLSSANLWQKITNLFRPKPKFYKGDKYQDAQSSNSNGWDPNIDAILDKMAKHGIHSLSKEEWDILDKYRNNNKP